MPDRPAGPRGAGCKAGRFRRGSRRFGPRERPGCGPWLPEYVPTSPASLMVWTSRMAVFVCRSRSSSSLVRTRYSVVSFPAERTCTFARRVAFSASIMPSTRAVLIRGLCRFSISRTTSCCSSPSSGFPRPMSPSSASGCIRISLQASARMTLLPVTVCGTQATVLTSAMSTDVKKRRQPIDLVKRTRPRRDLQHENRPPLLRAGLALQRQCGVLHASENDVVHRAGECQIAGQRDVRGSFACPRGITETAHFRAKRFNRGGSAQRAAAAGRTISSAGIALNTDRRQPMGSRLSSWSATDPVNPEADDH